MKKEEIFNKVLEYFEGDELSAKVWIDKYALRDNSDSFYENTPRDMHKRMSKEIARIEKKYPNPLSEKEVFEVLDKFKYIVPQGSPMFGIGNNKAITSLSNCFVIGNNQESDSYGGIIRADEEQVQIMKRRGGVGQDISHIRPASALTSNSILSDLAGTVLYMERYSNSTREVAQGGRRGALMLSIHVEHPDTDRFIDIKLKEGKVTGANISVKVTDEFMEAVENDEDFYQTFPVNLSEKTFQNLEDIISLSDLEYNKLTLMPDIPEIKGRAYIKKIKAKKLWNKIVKNAHQSAEPGILFWDKIVSESPADSYGENWKTLSTNPCGEIPLNAYSSCILLALNLFSYVKNPFSDTEAEFDFNLFRKHVRIAQRILDDIVDLEIEKINQILNKIDEDPEPEEIKEVEKNVWLKIRKRLEEGRRTGLGVTAEGDMIAALGMFYGTIPATDFSEKVHKVLAVESYNSSVKLAEERGAFPIWDYEKEKNNPFINRVLEEANRQGIILKQRYKESGRRNISSTTLAPTGSTSIMTQTTSGIEPVFLPYYKRRRKTDNLAKTVFVDETGDRWEEYTVLHHKFVDWYIVKLKEKFSDFYVWYDGTSYNRNDVVDFLQNLKSELLDTIVAQSPYSKATSADIDWKSSVELQGRVQQWIDHSISKTVNLPSNTVKETVDTLYRTAWKSGCKGVTVYRDGSRSGVLLSNKSKKDIEKEFVPKDAYRRPGDVFCDIYFPTIKGEKFIVMVGLENNNPYEVFAYKLKEKILSENTKHGIIVKRKSGHYDLLSKDRKEVLVNNFSEKFETPEEEDRTRLISGWLRNGGNVKYIVDVLNKSKGDLTTFSKVVARQLKKYVKDGEKSTEKCTNCGENLVFEEGCLNCKSCGFSKC